MAMLATPSHRMVYTRSRPSYSRVSSGSKRFEEEELEVRRVDGTGNKDGENEKEQMDLGDEHLDVYGYRKHYFLYFLTWSMILLTCGVLRLVFHWCPQWMLMATHVRCGLNRATAVLVVERYQKHKKYYVKEVKVLSRSTIQQQQEDCPDSKPPRDDSFDNDRPLPLHVGNGAFKNCSTIRMFCCKKLSYYWDDASNRFRKLNGLDEDITTAALHRQTGLTAQQQFLRRIVYGKNDIVIPAKGVLTLLWFEVLNPFYIFQICSFVLWFVDEYFYYAMAILLMSAFGIVASIVQTRRNQSRLRSTVHSVDVVTVVRGSSKATCTVTTEQLVPGDLILIPSHGCVMHCDAVLLAGNCIVNESMLTGESVPVTKTPVPNLDTLPYDDKDHAKHTLFCGTQVIQTRYYGDESVYAVVVRTGFCTSKGSLVRSIMYPPPVDFKFEVDSYKFVTLLAVVAGAGFLYTSVSKYLRGVAVHDIAMDALDLITIAVPPALPAAMTVGRMYAQRRLQRNDVYCISPRSINVSGSIDCVCFDKTGTLTEEGLDMWGVIPFEDNRCADPVRHIPALHKDHLLFAMATCHSLTIIDGKLAGDPLDLKMFESTQWLLEEPDVSDNTKFDMVHPTVVRPREDPLAPAEHPDAVFPAGTEIGIIRQFPFSSNLQRMSVITKTLGEKDFVIYCKGSPEMILSLSRPQSVPPDFNSVLREYTEKGYRVLALAYRHLVRISYPKVQRIQREDVEQTLTLAGLVVLENKLKPQTTGVIKELREANIRTIMVTGDNMLTALSVARDCGIVPTGQRVILAHSKPAKGNDLPVLYYTNSYCSTPSSICNGSAPHAPDSCAVTIDSLNSGSDISDLGYSLAAEPSLTDYSFAITGATWATLQAAHPRLVPRLLTRGAVFARMSPDQKQMLVKELQALGYHVAMCGDGANDCGALKAANAGVSLSEAESSVASPFTSKQANISCIPLVIREGRTALVTSFGIFKYIAAYSLVQFISVLILYSIESDLTDVEFLYIDLFIITTFVFFFGRTESHKGALSRKPPLSSLMSLSPILSLLLQIALVAAVQLAAFYHVQEQEWFVSSRALHNATGANGSGANGSGAEGLGKFSGYENYAVFGTSSLQYIILAVVFSKGKPYRKSVLANHGLVASIVVVTGCTVYLIVEPSGWLRGVFELMVPPEYGFRGVILAYGAVNLALAAFFEYFIVDYVAFKKLRYRFHDIEKSKKRYLAVERRLRCEVGWPVVVQEQGGEGGGVAEEGGGGGGGGGGGVGGERGERGEVRVMETQFQRPVFEIGNLRPISEFGAGGGGGRVRRYSENCRSEVENGFSKMSVPNLSGKGWGRGGEEGELGGGGEEGGGGGGGGGGGRF